MALKSSPVSRRIDSSVIPRISDEQANTANIQTIDELVKTEKYHHIVAWGKWLGFTSHTIQKSVGIAEAENAPEDSIQKIDGDWLRVCDIANDANRKKVELLAMAAHG